MSVSISTMQGLIRRVTARLDRRNVYDTKTFDWSNTERLVALGADGWRLCAVVDGVAYLQKEIGGGA